MKIIDIIADESLYEGGASSRIARLLGLDTYIERKAAERALAAIEKKYANDIVRKNAAKDVAERYAKLLADAEVAGTPRYKGGLKDIEDLLKDAAKNPNHPTLRNNRYYEDVEFMKMVDDLAEARKTQMIRDIQNPPAPPKEKKPKDEKAKGETSKVTKAEVAATDEIVEKSKKSGLAVSSWITMITGLTQFGFFAEGWINDIYREYERDLATNLSNLKNGVFSPGDEQFFPPVKTQGTPVSSIGEAFYFENDQKKFFVYDTETKRMFSYHAWRDSTARTLLWSKTTRYGASWTFTTVISSFTLGGKLLMFQKMSKVFSELSGKWKWLRWPGYTLDIIIASLSTYAKDKLAELMAGDKIDEAMRSLVFHKIDSWGPLVSQTGANIDKSLEGHKQAVLILGWVVLKIEELLGVGIEPRTAQDRPEAGPTVPVANPNEKDPSQKGKQVDQTDSNGTTPAPVAKPEEKTTKQDAPNIPSEDNSTAGRAAKFSAAMDAGAAEVVIGRRTYKTADFVDSGRYWTNPKTGESFLKN
jgi:hypothetical protein